MKIQPADIADRFTILKLKVERICPCPEEVVEEFMAYEASLTHDLCTSGLIERLYEVNGNVWRLESDIRLGKEGKLGLEEIGRRALAIRDLNAQRIAIKNEIAKRYGGFQEIKKDHASEATA